MVLDDLSRRERRGVASAFVLAIMISVVTGYAGATVTDSTSAEASTGEIESLAQSLMDQQVAQQEQQLSLIADQSENISQGDVSVSANVDDVSQSDIQTLYRADIAVEGQAPNQEGTIESVNQEQTLYISGDGRYVFSEPTDLQAQQQQPSQTTSSGQSSGQTSEQPQIQTQQ